MEDELFDVFTEPTTTVTQVAFAAVAAKESAGSTGASLKRKRDEQDADANVHDDNNHNDNSNSNSNASLTTISTTSTDSPHDSNSDDTVLHAPVDLSQLDPEDDRVFCHYVEQQLEVHNIVQGDRSCLMEIAYPPYWDQSQGSARFITYPSSSSQAATMTPTSSHADSTLPHTPERPPVSPAKSYPFTLDPFQAQAIECLERNQSVLVSAHTSAGKTVVAEYAIAMALRAGQRVIYTSPIKALSNQKFRELHEEFKDVGLMTGDVTINPSASCLVMTTEILRNMLYRGSEVVREVATIVYDEIHYMRNKERGVVWEETIIMVPHSVTFVFLSATIPNAAEFAMWIAKLHHRPCNVVYTDYRPTPLQHYLFPAGGDGLYLCVDDKGVFREENFQKAIAVLGASEATQGTASATGTGTSVSADGSSSSSSSSSGDAGGAGGTAKKRRKQSAKGSASDIYKIVHMIMERQYQPVIVFSFSKRECEQHALAMAQLDFCDDDDMKLINEIFRNAIDSLSVDDQRLPQVQNLLPLLRRGIGVHHSGLLPILKEVIEILFQEGLVKCLFSTETFSMGLNMPAKTVVFTSVRKWDGVEFRVVTGGEYIQMSGRAGRRGLDDRGIVICMMDEQMEPAVAKSMMKGESDVLVSSFHLGYNMLLNLLRVEDQTAVKMMSRSFHQFQSTRKAPQIQEQIDAKERALMLHRQTLVDERGISEYAQLIKEMEREQGVMRAKWLRPEHVVRFLNPGRIVRVGGTKPGDPEWGWGVLLNFHTKTVSRVKGAEALYILDVLLHATTESAAAAARSASDKRAPVLPVPVTSPDMRGEWVIVPVLLTSVLGLSEVRLVLPKELKSKEARKKMGQNVGDVQRKLNGVFKLLDPIKDMKIQDEDVVRATQRLESLNARLRQSAWAQSQSQSHSAAERDAELAKWRTKTELEDQLMALRRELRAVSEDVVMMSNLKYMHTVLRRMELVNANNVIELKGRVAAEVSTCDELVATELMFNGAFMDLTVPQTVALCSCLVFNEKPNDDAPRLDEALAAPYRILRDVATRIGNVISDARLPIDVAEYVERFQPGLMEVVYAWCEGKKFAEICKLTHVFEGTIIRCLRRLEELLRQLANASKSVGNEPLEKKFADGIELLKRDIVFAASLYL